MANNGNSKRVVDMLQGLLIDMHDARNSQLILEKILGRVTTLMNAHRSDFVLWDDDQNDLIVTAVYGERVSQTVKVGQSFPQNSFIRALWDDKNSNFRMSSNVLTEKAYYESDPRVKSEIAIRLELEDQPIGIFNIESFEKKAFQEEDRRLLTTVAPYATVAVQIARQEMRLWSIVHRALEYQPSPKPEEGLEEILKSLFALYHLNSLIYVANEQDKTLELTTLFGSEQAKVRSQGHSYRFEDNAAATLVYKNNKSLFFEDLCDKRINQDGLKRSDIRGPFLILPLSYGSHVVGVLVAWRNEKPFATEGLLKRLTSFAHLAAAKIAMRDQERRRFLFESLMNNVPYFIYFKDSGSRFIEVNEAFARKLSPQTNPEAVKKHKDSDFFAPEHADNARADELEVMRSGKPLTKEEKEVWLDGRPDSWVLTTKIPLQDPTGRTVGTFGISHDITESEYLQQLTDQLALAGVALSNPHDLLQPLTDIRILAENAEDDICNQDIESTRSRIQKIIHTCEEGINTIQEVLNAAKKAEVKLLATDINACIQEWMIPYSGAIQEKDANYDLQLFTNIPKVAINYVLMRQAFQNICRNAICHIRNGDAFVVATSQSGSEMYIEIRDGGPGFPREVLVRKRPPFIASYKKQVGLGLTIVHRIMQLHNGRLVLGKSLEGGASVKLIIPINTL